MGKKQHLNLIFSEVLSLQTYQSWVKYWVKPALLYLPGFGSSHWKSKDFRNLALRKLCITTNSALDLQP